MGLGKLFTRNIQYDVTDTVTDAHETFTIFTDGGGFAPDWSTGAYQGGMGLPGAWRASTLIADLLGGLPWHAYRDRPDGTKERLSPTPPLLEQPSYPDTRIDTFSAMVLDLVWEGNAFAIVAARNAQLTPTAITPVPARSVAVRRDSSGQLEYRVGTRTFGVGDVIHIKGPSTPGSLRGMGVLEAHINGSLRLADDQARQARSVVREGGVPTGVVSANNPDVTTEELKSMKDGWLKSQRERTIAFIQNAEFKPIAWNPTESQLLEARMFSLHEIALIFGVPLYFLGVESSNRTYSNVEQEGLNLVRYSLNGHLARFEQALAAAFPRGTYVKANLDSLLRADTKTRFETYEIALRSGALTVDEVRELEDRKPLLPSQMPQPAPVEGPAETEGVAA